jgi:hypothetical protein
MVNSLLLSYLQSLPSTNEIEDFADAHEIDIDDVQDTIEYFLMNFVNMEGAKDLPPELLERINSVVTDYFQGGEMDEDEIEAMLGEEGLEDEIDVKTLSAIDTLLKPTAGTPSVTNATDDFLARALK